MRNQRGIEKLIFTGLSAGLLLTAQTGFAEKIYLRSNDFPPDQFTQYPRPALENTKFFEYLDKEMSAGGRLELTNTPTSADYVVELRCGGYFHCSKLMIDIRTPDRKILSTYAIAARKTPLLKPSLAGVSREIAITLVDQIDALAEGGYGYRGTKYVPPPAIVPETDVLKSPDAADSNEAAPPADTLEPEKTETGPAPAEH